MRCMDFFKVSTLATNTLYQDCKLKSPSECRWITLKNDLDLNSSKITWKSMKVLHKVHGKVDLKHKLILEQKNQIYP